MRLLGDEIDRAAAGAFARQQRCRSFQEFDALEIGGVHDARRHVLRADLDAVVEHVDLAVGEAAHRERRRLGRIIAGGDADRALCNLRNGPIAPLADGLLIDHLDRRRHLAHGQAQSGSTFGHDVGVERCMGNLASAGSRRWRRHRGLSTGAARNTSGATAALRAGLGSTYRLALGRRDDDGPETFGLCLCLRSALRHHRSRGARSKESNQAERRDGRAQPALDRNPWLLLA